MAIAADGTLYAWGNEVSGLLGNGKENYKPCPAMQSVLGAVATISVSPSHALAVTNDGVLYGWGLCGKGQLGLRDERYGTYISPTRPTLITTGVKAAVAGYDYSLVIKTDGSLWAMGANIFGQLGIGEADYDEHALTKVMDDVASVSASCTPSPHTLAVKADGTLWAWGQNMYGELGDGTTQNRGTPVKVMDGVASAATGYGMNSMAVKTDGSLWGWGSNLYGVLSKGAAATQRTPYRILSAGVASVALGEQHAMILKSDGSLWGLGCQLYGRLGDGVTANDGADAPVRVMSDVAAVAAGQRHSLIVGKDGTLLGCGLNESGCLGPDDLEGTVARPRRIGDVSMRIPIGVTLSAAPTKSTVLVNGKLTAFDAYMINGNNYFKLRDLACALSGTAKQFEVQWDANNNAISLTSAKPYTPVGGEMAVTANPQNKSATPTTSRVFLDGKEVYLTAFNIGGNNYFKLRSVAEAADFGVTWDSQTSTIGIDTSIGYTVP